MSVSLIAVDLDGTVLGPGRDIAPAGRAALQAAERAAITVALATGRMLRSAQRVQERLGLQGPLITYNGGLIRLPDGRQWEDPVPLDAARAIAALCHERGYFLQCYLGDRLYVPWPDPRADAYSELASVECTVSADIVWAPPTPPTKLLVIEPVERQPEVRAAVAAVVGDRCELAHSYPHYLEISRAGVHKGTALTRLAEVMGVPRAQVLAVGDGENDLPLILAAGIGVAVANAVPAVAAAAQHVCGARFGDGVAEAVRMFALGGGPGDGG